MTKIKETLKLSHSGAHKSTTWLTNNDIIELGHLAGFYVVFIQELIHNNNIPEIKEWGLMLSDITDKDIEFKDYRKQSDIHGTALYPAVMIAPIQKNT